MRYLFFLFLFCVAMGDYPSGAQQGAPVTAGNQSTMGGPTSNLRAPDSTGGDTATFDVLFATNEDCLLYIFHEFSGALLKSGHRNIALPPGTYQYKVKSSRTLDELRGKFVVSPSGFNEVFVDLLYVVDEKAGRLRLSDSAAKPTIATAQKRIPTPRKGNVPAPSMNKDTKEASINALVSNMVFIRGGDFVMGNNKAPSKDEIEHPVTVKSIHFGKYEVTQEQWTSIMEYNPSSNPNCSTCPVENVSWEEVMKFIRKLNVISDIAFRLPTEAEWEYVARIGGKAELEAAGGPEKYIKQTAWYFANSEKRTHPVGGKEPNISRIYDLYGNVSEWCMDWYAEDYYRDLDNVKNPVGPPLGKEKVIRGGSFSDYLGDNFRPSLRYKLKPTTKSPAVGFRLVMEVR